MKTSNSYPPSKFTTMVTKTLMCYFCFQKSVIIDIAFSTQYRAIKCLSQEDGVYLGKKSRRIGEFRFRY